MSDQEYSEEILAEEEDLSLFDQIQGTLSAYGWYILIFVVLLAYVFSRFKPYLLEVKRKREEFAYSAKYHKDSDLVRSRLEAQEAHARKLQEKYNRDAEAYQLKMKEKEEKKRERHLKELEGKAGGSGRKLGNEYNPLMGDTSRGYRAPKKSKCGGGGCG